MWLVSAIFAFSVAVLVHAALRRLKATNLNIGISFLIVAIAVAVVFLCLLVMEYGYVAPQTWAGILVFFLLCELYLFLVTLAMASVTANCLIRLARTQNADTKLEALYNSPNMVAIRIERLKTINLIRETSSGLISLTLAGKRTLQICSRVRSFFNHG